MRPPPVNNYVLFVFTLRFKKSRDFVNCSYVISFSKDQQFEIDLLYSKRLFRESIILIDWNRLFSKYTTSRFFKWFIKFLLTSSMCYFEGKHALNFEGLWRYWDVKIIVCFAVVKFVGASTNFWKEEKEFGIVSFYFSLSFVFCAGEHHLQLTQFCCFPKKRLANYLGRSRGFSVKIKILQ